MAVKMLKITLMIMFGVSYLLVLFEFIIPHFTVDYSTDITYYQYTNGHLMNTNINSSNTSMESNIYQSIFQRATADKYIMVLSVNYDSKELLANFICNVNEINFTNWILFASDIEITKYIFSTNLFNFDYVISLEQSMNYLLHYKQFNRSLLTKVKLFPVIIALSMKFKVIYSDIDVIYFKNPIKDIHNILTQNKNRLDIVIAQLQLQNNTQINSNFFYVNPYNNILYKLMVNILFNQQHLTEYTCDNHKKHHSVCVTNYNKGKMIWYYLNPFKYTSINQLQYDINDNTIFIDNNLDNTSNSISDQILRLKRNNLYKVKPDGVSCMDKHNPFRYCDRKKFAYPSGGFSIDNMYVPQLKMDIHDHKYVSICKETNTNHDGNASTIHCYPFKHNKKPHFVCIMNDVYMKIVNSRMVFYLKNCELTNESKLYIKPMKDQCDISFNSLPSNLNEIVIINNKSFQSIYHSKRVYLNESILYLNDKEEQCGIHKKNNKLHIGNPWHCIGHMERMAKWQELFNNKHETNILYTPKREFIFQISPLNNNNIPNDTDIEIPNMLGLTLPFFDININHNTLENSFNSNSNSNEYYKVNRVIMGKMGWGMALLWNAANIKKLMLSMLAQHCLNTDELMSSSLYKSMRSKSINYFDDNYLIKHNINTNHWIKSIVFNKEFVIYVNNIKITVDNIDIFINEFNDNRNDNKILFIATRYLNSSSSSCRYRCVKNMKYLLMNITNDKYFSLNNYNIIIYGNPGLLSFDNQYILFRNIDTFIGVHGAVFMMTALFMKDNTVSVEIAFNTPFNSQYLFAMMKNLKEYSRFQLDYGASNSILDIDIDTFIKYLKNVLRSH